MSFIRNKYDTYCFSVLLDGLEWITIYVNIFCPFSILLPYVFITLVKVNFKYTINSLRVFKKCLKYSDTVNPIIVLHRKFADTVWFCSSFIPCLQNAMIPYGSQELLPFL
jgi:hypothetical protein